MTPQERFEKFKEAAHAKAKSDAEFEIAKAALTFDLGDMNEQRYEINITHSEAAKDANVTPAAVLRWIRHGELKALPKDKTRKRKIPLNVWKEFKRMKGYA